MKSVLITGGSRGIGRAMVRLFAQNGFKVAFTYKNSENEGKILAEETKSLAIRADNECESDIISAVAMAKEAFGRIDVLINNAAISSFSLFTDLTLAEWNRALSVNLTGAFLYSREVARDMIFHKSGRIINISSMWGIVGSSCEVHYSTTKAALIGFTKALAKELAPSGITVNAIAPGVIKTEMNSSLSEEDLSVLSDQTPLGRLGEAEEVATAALFLASEGASFISGEVINVSGGYVM